MKREDRGPSHWDAEDRGFEDHLLPNEALRLELGQAAGEDLDLADEHEAIARHDLHTAIRELRSTGCVLHSVSPTDVAAGPHVDVAEVARPTAGVHMPLPAHGNIDLSRLPLADLILSGYVVKFRSEPDDTEHRITLNVLQDGRRIASQQFEKRY